MRRFFRAHRDEDYSQIQYLTAKCTRLAHDKAALDRDFLLSREMERRLQSQLEVATSRLQHQEQLTLELRRTRDGLLFRINQQQDLVSCLQRRVVLLLEASSRDGELLQEVGSELQSLQSSEVQLEGLVDELHAQAHDRTVAEESLRAELHRKTAELQELQNVNRKLTEELRDANAVHQKEVKELQRENEAGLRKLQETVEQFEWLCQQQRYWMCCVKRFKVCLMEERDALLRHVGTLEKKAEKPTDGSGKTWDTPSHLQDPERLDSKASWDADAEADVESQLEESNATCEELFNQAGSSMKGRQKPP
ncbi:transmembrane and coiled-coil domain-containing protein 5B-like isoform X2 [Antennarius striatus]|uniref:transmembrane and coiled-coil domain-containing protein 5B-like isoform X2 n=1 Tax=Antennarius striatus TaxID=241820 RepID=UPI0035ADFA92